MARARSCWSTAGGRAVDRLLKALHIESRFVEGRRETSPEAMAVVEMVLSGTVNKQLAAGLVGGGRTRDRHFGPRRRVSCARGSRRTSAASGTPAARRPGAAARALERGLPAGRVAGRERPARRGGERERRRGGARDRAGRGRRDARLSVRRGRRAARRAHGGAPRAPKRRGSGWTTERSPAGMALKVRVALEAAAAGIPEVVIAGKARLLGQFPGTRSHRAPARR